MTSVSPAVKRWLMELDTQRRQSVHTITAYRHELKRLQVLAGETALENLHAHQIRRFIAQLHAQGLSARSLARTLSAWRSFYRWLIQQDLIQNNPVSAIRPPKSIKKLPHGLSPDSMSALLATAGETTLEIRDHAIFELFYSSGLRLSELSNLDIACMSDVINGEIRVLGKRSKTRIIPVGTKACTALNRWLAHRTPLVRAEETALFVSRTGQRLSTRMIQYRLARHAQRIGLPTHVHPHMLRHSFASHLLQSSGDLRAVQEMLGHNSIASTQIYTQLDFQHLAQVYDATHPRAKNKP